MQLFINSAFNIGGLAFSNRLIQGPLAGFSCAPFRQLFYQFTAPAYCVSEMISANDVLLKHQRHSRYLYRAPEEKILCYQLAGRDPLVMAAAARRVEMLGADLIDLNCGCPKAKIRKKGAGSALLDEPKRLIDIVHAVRKAIAIPLTIKLRIQGNDSDVSLARALAQAGADALIVHGRRWVDDYDVPSDVARIAAIKRAVTIPVIANGDIADKHSLTHAITSTGCDAFMIARAGSGNPWIYQQLLTPAPPTEKTSIERVDCFMTHLLGLARLESDHRALLQSKSLIRYYFKGVFSDRQLRLFYALEHLSDIERFLTSILSPEWL